MNKTVLVNYDNCKDIYENNLIKIAQQGDSDALEYLISKYVGYVKFIARSYYLIGGEQEDIIQEGMIGLYKSIRDYNIQKQTTFANFARLCIRRQIITAIKTATRQKHMLLNTYVSLDKPIYDESSDKKLIDILYDSNNLNPELIYINRQYIGNLKKIIHDILSRLEYNTLMLYLEGYSYQQIADNLKVSEKSIDNAMFRIKRKLNRFTQNNDIL